jgi:hypothetical protein
VYSRRPWERRELASIKRIRRLEARLKKSTGGLLELPAVATGADD